jgi:hypothetical protein
MSWLMKFQLVVELLFINLFQDDFKEFEVRKNKMVFMLYLIQIKPKIRQQFI